MDWDYIAGFFDGEGSVSLTNKDRGAAVQIRQNDLQVLSEVKAFLIQHGVSGVSIYTHKPYSSYGRGGKVYPGKTSYHLNISSRVNCIKFLEQMSTRSHLKVAKVNECLARLRELEASSGADLSIPPPAIAVMSKDEVKVPENIASMTKDQRRGVAKDLIRTTHLSNEKIAQATGLSKKAIAVTRLHLQGKIPDPPLRRGSIEHVPEAVEVPEGQTLEGDEEPELHSIDDKTPPTPRSPELAERSEVVTTSMLQDMKAEMEGLRASVSMAVAAMKNAGAGGAPGSQGTRVEERVTTASFDLLEIKLKVDTYRAALFSAWKSMHNAEAAQNGGKTYVKEIDGFLIDCFDGFMEERGIDFTYTETTAVRPTMMPRSR